MKTFKPNFTKFTEAQRQLWPSLAPAAERGFVLYGGMGLSSRFGHRGSVDFDFFTSAAFDADELRAAMPFLQTAETLQNERGTYTASLKIGNEDVRVAFFSVKIPRVGEPEFTDDGVCEVAAIEDLAATKIKVLLDRIQASDYRDILTIVSHGLPLEQCIAAATALFGSSFQPYDVLKALTHFEGGDLEKLTGDERERLRSIAQAVRDIPVRVPLSHDLSMPMEPRQNVAHTRRA